MTGHQTTVVAFASADRGLGRTSAVANTALILAGAGSRVLIIDWTVEPPGVRDYFSAVDPRTSPDLDALVRDIDRATEGLPGVWRAEGFKPPEGIRPIDLLRPEIRPEGEPPGLRWTNAGVADELRRVIEDRGYDYVLTDTPTRTNPEAINIIARLSQRAVVLSGPSRESVDRARALAARFRNAAGAGLRIVPVISEPGAGDPPRGGLEEFLTGDEQIIRLPHAPEHRGRTALAALARPDGALTRAYCALAGRLAGDRTIAPPEVSADLRRFYRVALGLETPMPAESFTIQYAWADRQWADWVSARLRTSGGWADLARYGTPASGRTIAIVSPDASAELPDGRLDGDLELVILVGGADAPPGNAPVLRLDDYSAAEAGSRLAGALLLLVAGVIPVPPAAVEPRFPPARRPPGIVNFPVLPRGPFVGREDELSALRDRLMSGREGCVPYVLDGPPGIGKTGLVQRYVELFGGDYDLIWWITARTPELAREGLAELAGALPRLPAGDKVAAVLGHLRTSRERWLLIYDDASDLEELNGLIPTGGSGHALVTSRAGDRGAARLAPIGEAASVEMLRARVRDLDPEDAAEIAALLRGLPLALALATAWLGEVAEARRAELPTTARANAQAVAEFRALFAEAVRTAGGSAGEPTDEDVTRACLAVTYGTLAKERLGRLALRLLELCSWLAPEGVTHGLLSFTSFLDQLAVAAGPADGDLLRADSLMLDQAMRMCARYGLAEVVWGNHPMFRVHRMVQELVRRGMTEAEATARQAQVLCALAGAVPPVVSGPSAAHAVLLPELGRHLEPSGALKSGDPGVRDWIIRHVRHQYTSDDGTGMRAVLKAAGPLLDRWPSDVRKGRLLIELANVHRQLGEIAAAGKAADEALRILRPLGPESTLPVLIASVGRAADLRGLGGTDGFSESFGELLGVYEQMAQLLGPDHPQTVLTKFNLAESAFLAGQQTRARDLAREAWEQQVVLSGPEHWLSMELRRRYGDYAAAIGDLPKARELLDEGHDIARVTQGFRPSTRMELLRSRAVVMRAVQDWRTEKDLTPIRTAYNGLAALYGPGHVNVLAIRLSLATGLDLIGRSESAAEEARACILGYERRLAENHPFLHLCRLDLGLFLLHQGNRVDEASAEVETAYTELDAALRSAHPWTILAALHRAVAKAARDDADARDVLDRAAEDSLEHLGETHPYALAARALQEPSALRGGTTKEIDRMLYVDVPYI